MWTDITPLLVWLLLQNLSECGWFLTKATLLERLQWQRYTKKMAALTILPC